MHFSVIMAKWLPLSIGLISARWGFLTDKVWKIWKSLFERKMKKFFFVSIGYMWYKKNSKRINNNFEGQNLVKK